MSLLLLFKSEPYISLYNSATQWDKQGHHKEAIILAQISLELISERAFNKIIDSITPNSLQDWLRKSLEDNHNIANEKVRKLYEALSGNLISQESFWSRLQEHNTLRNDVVHSGKIVTSSQAAASLRVVKEVKDYFEQKHF
jgi:hypothetical protein